MQVAMRQQAPFLPKSLPTIPILPILLTRGIRRHFLHAAAGTLGALGTGFFWPTPLRAAGRDPPAGFNFPGPADAKATQDNPVGSPQNPGSNTERSGMVEMRLFFLSDGEINATMDLRNYNTYVI
jgi:hypothetical protein